MRMRIESLNSDASHAGFRLHILRTRPFPSLTCMPLPALTLAFAKKQILLQLAAYYIPTTPNFARPTCARPRPMTRTPPIRTHYSTQDFDMATSSASLGDLPAELVELVGSYAGPKDLLNLRLTRKDVAAKILRIMTVRCFGELHIMIAFPHSLKRAAAVAKHATLGEQIRTVTVHLDGPWRLPMLQWWRQRDNEWYGSNKESEEKHLQALYEKWRHEAEELACYGADQRALTAIFSALDRQSHNNALRPRWHLRTQKRCAHRFQGADPGHLSECETLCPRSPSEEQLESVFAAARKSELKIWGLHLPNTYQAWFGASLSIFQGVLGSSAFQANLQYLRTLKLYIPMTRNLIGMEERATDKTLDAGVEFFAKSVPSLTILELSGECHFWVLGDGTLSGRFRRVIQNLRFSHLNYIKVDHIVVQSSAELVRFFQTYASILEAWKPRWSASLHYR